jgi:hypothetical protein
VAVTVIVAVGVVASLWFTLRQRTPQTAARIMVLIRVANSLTDRGCCPIIAPEFPRHLIA